MCVCVYMFVYECVCIYAFSYVYIRVYISVFVGMLTRALARYLRNVPVYQIEATSILQV